MCSLLLLLWNFYAIKFACLSPPNISLLQTIVEKNGEAKNSTKTEIKFTSLVSVLCFSRYAGKPSSLEVIVTIETTLNKRLRERISFHENWFCFSIRWNLEAKGFVKCNLKPRRRWLFAVVSYDQVSPTISKTSMDGMHKHRTSQNAHHCLKISLSLSLTLHVSSTKNFQWISHKIRS